MSAIDIVLTTEVVAQNRSSEVMRAMRIGIVRGREQHSHTGPEGERPSEHVHQQAQIAWVANSTVHSIRDECVVLLDGHQPAESPAQHERWP